MCIRDSGKVIGGGMPVGAFGGQREIMEKIAPLGPVYQAGTLSGNPVAVAAGLATLKLGQQAGESLGGRAPRQDPVSYTHLDVYKRQVYQAGTLSGNPVAVAAGLATLKLVQQPGFHDALTQKTRMLCDGLAAAAKQHGVTFSAQSVGGMFGLYFRQKPPRSYAEVMACDKDAFNRFFHAMLDAGHYFAPSAFEAGFVSAAHSDADIAETVAAAEAIFKVW